MSVDHLEPRGILKGHNGWVTAIATSSGADTIISASRDKSLIVWAVTNKADEYAYAKKRLLGHSHFVQDVAITSDGASAVSGSWDGTLRLWDLKKGISTHRVTGHKKDVLSVAFSGDNRSIVSGSRDQTIKVWNSIGKLRHTFAGPEGHKDWVSCVRFVPKTDMVISASWDKTVKIWSPREKDARDSRDNSRSIKEFVGHTGYINYITVSPDGSLCASGGKDGVVMLWDIVKGIHLSTFISTDVINALAFCPVQYWLSAATASSIIIWDLESKICLDQIKPDYPDNYNAKKAQPIQCISICWSADGSTLFAGYTDNVIRVYHVAKNE